MTRNSRLTSLTGTKNKRLLFKVVKTNWTHNNRPFLDTGGSKFARALHQFLWLHVMEKKVLRNIAVHAVVTTYPKGIFPCCVISYIQVFCFVKHYTCTSSLLKWRLMSRVHIEKPCRGHNLPKGLFVFLV